MAAIYQEGIATGNATFETALPSWERWDAARLAECRLVALAGGEVVGWAALSPVSGREVYRGVAEVGVYVAAARRGRGIGRLLLRALVDASERRGIWTLQAAVFPENEATLHLHRALGFREVGRRERIGRLDGRWRDTLLLERRSRTVGWDLDDGVPTPPRTGAGSAKGSAKDSAKDSAKGSPEARLEQALGELTEARAVVERALSGIAPERRGARPAEDRWSAAEVVEHLALVEGAVLRLLAKGPGPLDEPALAAGSLDPALVRDRRRPIRAIGPTLPAAGLPWDEALDRLRATRRDLLARVGAAGASPLAGVRAPHFALGVLDGLDWLRFLAAHEARHAAQILEVARDLEAR